MESSDAETGMVECGVGTIVWVRRRNGSWWPGKILGPDELSASHLMSPRSGTPVKLLGREDASVDWYNLEKSKRVKAFRCGEFDECIERAEASQGMPPKKREKYARREDAILHALELEKQVLEKKYGKLLEISCDNVKEKGGNKSPDVRPDVAFKYKLPSLPAPAAATNGSHKNMLEKRKRPQEEGESKRRRLLVQVLESSAKQSKDHEEQSAVKPADQNSLSEDNTTASNEDTETDSSGSHTLSDEGEHIEFIPKAYGRCEDGSMSEEEESGEAVSKWQLKGKRKSRSVTKRKAMMSAGHWMSFIKGGEDTSEEEDEERGCWEEFRMLIDVDVGVQSGYQREHVPMISLMSKLNDKAIVGHPIPIEPLEDGSSDNILLDFQTLGYDAALQPWRTARRTAKCRLPRPPTLEEQEEEEETPFEYYDASSKGRKWPAPPKKRTNSSFTTQKIRTLSSIGGSQHQHQGMDLTGGEEEEEEGSMMMMKSESTAVACIPVKLVFSRLHEELVNK